MNSTGILQVFSTSGRNDLIIQNQPSASPPVPSRFIRKDGEPELEVKDMSENIMGRHRSHRSTIFLSHWKEVSPAAMSTNGTHANPGQVQVAVTSKSAHRT